MKNNSAPPPPSWKGVGMTCHESCIRILCCCGKSRKRRYSDVNYNKNDNDGNDTTQHMRKELLLLLQQQQQQRRRPKTLYIFIISFLIVAGILLRRQYIIMLHSLSTLQQKQQQQHQQKQQQQQQQQHEALVSTLHNTHSHCAINFYGLPRQYYTMVHNSILQNIIIPNIQYNCDYYIHYYNDTTIESTIQQRGADIGHGNIYFNPNEILLHLKKDVLQLHYNYHHHPNHNDTTIPTIYSMEEYQPPNIQYETTNEDEFQQQYTSLLRTIHEYQDPITKQYIYLPLSETLPFSNTTITNIIKMWHSQQSVFTLMDSYHPKHIKKHYNRIGLFRNDVIYVTPINIYEIPLSIKDMDYRHQNQRRRRNEKMNKKNNNRLFGFNKILSPQQQQQQQVSYDIYNQYAVIPDFANHPINDRMIYGPYDAILIYATYKFRLLHNYIHQSQINHKQQHYGIHSEQYLYHTILPMIQNYGQITILQHPTICFLRVRTDYSIRINDCTNACTTSQLYYNIHNIIESQLLLRSCYNKLDMTLPHVPFLLCPPQPIDIVHNNNTQTSSISLSLINNNNNNLSTTTKTTTTKTTHKWDFCTSTTTTVNK